MALQQLTDIMGIQCVPVTCPATCVVTVETPRHGQARHIKLRSNRGHLKTERGRERERERESVCLCVCYTFVMVLVISRETGMMCIYQYVYILCVYYTVVLVLADSLRSHRGHLNYVCSLYII